MLPSSKRLPSFSPWAILAGFALIHAASLEAADSAGQFTVQREQKPDRLVIQWRGQPILTYVTSTNPCKPYVQELRTLEGVNVLRDSPPDHFHHHGLMYAIRVNDHNFWEEREMPGYQVPKPMAPPRTGRNAVGLPMLSFTQDLYWVPDAQHTAADLAAVALLDERRTLTLTVDEKNKEVGLGWHSDFKVGKGAAKVTLAGADYHGLGMRLPESFDKVARHANAEKTPYKTANQRDVIEARWGSITGQVNGQDITVACLGKPVEKGVPQKFFTMLDPFAYVSATQGLDLVTRDHAAGDHWTVSYLVLVYSGARSPEALEQRYRSWTGGPR